MKLKLLLLLALAINLVAATAPFRLDPPRIAQNQIETRADGALVFHGSSMARTASPPGLLADAAATDMLSVDLSVTPASADQSGPARILAISQDYTSQNLMIGQEGDSLVIRLRRPGSGEDGEPAFAVPGTFQSGRASDISLRITPGNLRVDANGRTAIAQPLPERALQDWDSAFNLALGNEIIGRRAWSGVIDRAVIATPAHREDLLEPGRLDHPAQWWEVPHRLSILFETDLPLGAFVALLHFAAFAPIGYSLRRLNGSHRTWLWIALVLLLLAAGIEGAKILIEDRHPSILNLAANLAGGLAGAFAAPRLRFLGRPD